MRAIVPILLTLGAACGHEQPWYPVAPPANGPYTNAVPRRLTFNTGDDRAPALWTAGGLIAFSRYDPIASPTSCIAYLPAGGGTLVGTYCPPLPSAADTFVSTWSAPVLSPDGRRVAFLWERSASTSALGAWTSELIVAPAAALRAPTFRWALQEILPEGYVNSIVEPAWIGGGAIRFLAAFDSIWKVKGGGAERFTDSAFVPRVVMEADPASGVLRRVAGGDSALAWTPGAGDNFWIVRAPARLLQVSGGVATERDAFSQPVADLAFVSGTVVAALGDSAAVEWIDPVTGARGQIATPGPVRRVSPAGGRRFVAEVERGVDPFGRPANLWLFELP